jgi:hypothetical protein
MINTMPTSAIKNQSFLPIFICFLRGFYSLPSQFPCHADRSGTISGANCAMVADTKGIPEAFLPGN